MSAAEPGIRGFFPLPPESQTRILEHPANYIRGQLGESLRPCCEEELFHVSCGEELDSSELSWMVTSSLELVTRS